MLLVRRSGLWNLVFHLFPLILAAAITPATASAASVYLSIVYSVPNLCVYSNAVCINTLSDSGLATNLYGESNTAGLPITGAASVVVADKIYIAQVLAGGVNWTLHASAYLEADQDNTTDFTYTSSSAGQQALLQLPRAQAQASFDYQYVFSSPYAGVVHLTPDFFLDGFANSAVNSADITNAAASVGLTACIIDVTDADTYYCSGDTRFASGNDPQTETKNTTAALVHNGDVLEVLMTLTAGTRAYPVNFIQCCNRYFDNPDPIDAVETADAANTGTFNGFTAVDQNGNTVPFSVQGVTSLDYTPPAPSPTPEPSSLLLIALGTGGMAGWRRVVRR